MTDSQPDSFPRSLRLVLVIVGIVIVLGAILGIVYLFGGKEPIPVAAELLTALGTLALAWYTFDLARATRRSVGEGAAELDELRQQRSLLERQADTAADQVSASRASALAAEKARVDASAPLLYLQVEIFQVKILETDRPVQALDPAWRRPSSYLPNIRFEITLRLLLENVGRAPARLSFGDTSWFLERRQADNLTGVVLKVGETYIDTYIVRLAGDEVTAGRYVMMPFTYEGTMHGEMFDRIQWNGWVTGAKVDGLDVVPYDLVMNSSGAQVIREYPNIERPDEMAEVRRKLIQGPDQTP